MLDLWCSGSEKSSLSQVLLKWYFLLLFSFFSCDPLSVDLIESAQQVNFHFWIWTNKENLASISDLNNSFQQVQNSSNFISYPHNKGFLVGSDNKEQSILAIEGQGFYLVSSYNLENPLPIKDTLLNYLFQSRELGEVFFYKGYFYFIFNKPFKDDFYKSGTRIVQFSLLEKSSHLISYSFQIDHPNLFVNKIFPFNESWLIEYILDNTSLFIKETPPFFQKAPIQDSFKINSSQSSLLNKHRFLNFVQQRERKDEVSIFTKDSQGSYESSLENYLDNKHYFEAIEDGNTLTLLTQRKLYFMNKKRKIKEILLPTFHQQSFKYHNVILTSRGYLILWTKGERVGNFIFGLLLIPYTK